MKIGVVSDTHGHLDILRSAVNEMVKTHKIDTLIHLGDDSTDIDSMRSLLPTDIYTVPGTYEKSYALESVPNRQILELEGIPFLLSHTPARIERDLEGDINPTEAIQDQDVQIFLHGHTHVWRITEENGVIIINPGHLVPLKDSTSKGNPPTYGIIDLSGRKIDVRIYGLDNKMLSEKTFFFLA